MMEAVQMITILYYNSVHNMDSVYSLQPNGGGSSKEYLVFAKYLFHNST